MLGYRLTDNGEMPADRRHACKAETGIPGVEMTTVDLLVARDGTLIHHFTCGETLGVRRVLQLAREDGAYSLGELDTRLRRCSVDTERALPV